MCTIRNSGLFRLLNPPGYYSGQSGEDLQAQKWRFWMVSVEFDHRLPAELPLTAENHWFSSQIQPQPDPGPHGGNQWIWHRKIMFFTGISALNVFRTLLRHGNHPHGTLKVSETIWYHGIGWDPHNPEISNLVFSATEKNRFVHILYKSFKILPLEIMI